MNLRLFYCLRRINPWQANIPFQTARFGSDTVFVYVKYKKNKVYNVDLKRQSPYNFSDPLLYGFGWLCNTPSSTLTGQRGDLKLKTDTLCDSLIEKRIDFISNFISANHQSVSPKFYWHLYEKTLLIGLSFTIHQTTYIMRLDSLMYMTPGSVSAERLVY